MVVLSEASDKIPPSASARDIHAATEAAKLAGYSVYYIPQDFDECGDADGALWHVPRQTTEAMGFWIGYIPTLERYEQIYAAAATKHICLVNTPEQHRIAQEFDSAYPRLEALTPQSCIVTDVSECASAAEQLGFPVFVKGVVQSRKARGWKACVAASLPELEQIVQSLLDLSERSRGRVVVRRLVSLRHHRTSGEGFPLGREYRLFLYQRAVVGLGYYWEGDDDYKALSPDERQQVCDLALDAARRLDVPYVSIDIGQMDDGKWIVIECGDGQFSGVSQVPRLALWGALASRTIL